MWHPCQFLNECACWLDNLAFTTRLLYSCDSLSDIESCQVLFSPNRLTASSTAGNLYPKTELAVQNQKAMSCTTSQYWTSLSRPQLQASGPWSGTVHFETKRKALHGRVRLQFMLAVWLFSLPSTFHASIKLKSVGAWTDRVRRLQSAHSGCSACPVYFILP